MEEMMNLHFTSVIWAFVLPLILMVLDIVTGYYNAWKNDEVSSQKMRDGLGKKCAELSWVAIGALFNFAFGASAIMYFIIIYVCFMELVSLAENADKLGFKLPSDWNLKVNNTKNKEDK